MSISSTEYEPSPAYPLRPSRQLRIVLLALPALAVTALLAATGLPAGVRFAVILIAVPWVIGVIRRHWPGAERAPRVLRFEPEGRCRIRFGDETEVLARMSDTLILPGLVIISLRDCPGCRALVVPRDALAGAEAHRRLRREARQC